MREKETWQFSLGFVLIYEMETRLVRQRSPIVYNLEKLRVREFLDIKGVGFL